MKVESSMSNAESISTVLSHSIVKFSCEIEYPIFSSVWKYVVLSVVFMGTRYKRGVYFILYQDSRILYRSNVDNFPVYLG